MTWRTYGANEPRFVAPDGWLLIEGARTNLTPNPRCEGFTAGTIGSGGALPTGANGWFRDQAAGLAWTLSGGTMAGLPYLEVALSGTTTSTGGVLRYMGNVVPVVGATYAAAYSLAVTGGSLANITTIQVGSQVTGGTGTGATNFDLGSLSATAWQRRERIATIGAGATALAGRLLINFASGVAIDVTLRIAAPQLEEAPFASTPILPPAGTPGASTRGRDAVSASLASLGIPASGRGGLILTGRIPQSAPAGVAQIVAQFSDGTDDNRIVLRNAAGGNTMQLIAVVGGVAGTPVSLGSMTPGTAFRIGMKADGDGRVFAQLDGNAGQAITGAPSSALTTVHLGGGVAGEALFGQLGRATAIPRPLSDAEFSSLLLAQPIP